MSMFRKLANSNPVKTVGSRASRAFRPQDIVPSVKKAVRPQDVVPSVRRLSDPRNWPEFVEERREALERWIIARGASFWMEPPVMRLVNPGGHGGDPIVYINGVNTKEDEAIVDAEMLSLSLRRPVQLLYNPTNVDEIGDFGMAADSIEAFYDLTYSLPAPQMNHTTRQLTHLLYHSEGRISLVTHSQGCLIARNSLRTMEFFREKNKVVDNLAWIAAGSPVNRNLLSFAPNRFKDLLIPGDFVGQVLGAKFGQRWYEMNRRRHEFVHEDIRSSSSGRILDDHASRDPNDVDYLALIELIPNRDTLWPSGNSQTLVPTRKFAKFPILVNETNTELRVELMRQIPETNTQWFFTNQTESFSIPAGEEIEMIFATQQMRVRATAGSRRWNRWDDPVRLAPANGFLTTVAKPRFEINFTERRSPDEARKVFGVERSFLNSGDQWQWFDVSDDAAYREGPGETEFFEQAMVNPATFSGSPFSDATALHRTHFGYFRAWPKSDHVWFLPRDATGDVWIYDPAGSWTREGRIGEYEPSSSSPFGENDLDDFPDVDLEAPGLIMAIDELRRSTWDSSFTVGGGRRNAVIQFDGTRGTYRQPNGLVGHFSDVEYRTSEGLGQIDIFVRWRLGNQTGVAQFGVSAIEGTSRGVFTKFTGDWWRGQGLGAPEGTWDGTRRDETFAFFRVRNPTAVQVNASLQWEGPSSPLNQVQLAPDSEQVFATRQVGQIATAMFRYEAPHIQATIHVHPPFEIGIAAASGPRWRTLSSLDFRKMRFIEFFPQGFGGVSHKVVTRKENGVSDEAFPE